MNKKRKETRQRLKDIKTKREFLDLLDEVKLTDEERTIAEMVFLKGQGYSFIADTLGYAERTVKAKMRKILNILSK